MIAVTALLALAVLAMAVAETNLWLHYLIDAGESISLVGLAFVAAAGVFLYTRGQLRASLPLMAPWLLFPVITQGDQIIDNLSINWMRVVVHVLLAPHLRHSGRRDRGWRPRRRDVRARAAAGAAGAVARDRCPACR